jgi:hypothetical protein
LGVSAVVCVRLDNTTIVDAAQSATAADKPAGATVSCALVPWVGGVGGERRARGGQRGAASSVAPGEGARASALRACGAPRSACAARCIALTRVARPI